MIVFDIISNSNLFSVHFGDVAKSEINNFNKPKMANRFSKSESFCV